MSLFDKYSILHGFPKPGQKIKFIKPANFHWFTNVKEDEETLLVPGQEYEVVKTNLNSSSSYVFLKEFWIDGLDEYRNNQKMFSMSAFEWDKPELVLDELIGFNARSLTQLNDTYGYGITLNDKVWVEGDPMLIVVHDERGITTSVKFKV